MKVAIGEKTGLVIARDASLRLPARDVGPDYRDPLKRLARDGNLFFIDQLEATNTEIEILVDQPLSEAFAERYEPVGGNFRLELPTGCLVVSSYGAWLSGQNSAPEAISVAPGSYSLVVFSPRAIDPEMFGKRIRELVGDTEWNHYLRVENFSTVGCISIAIAAGALFIPVVRAYWRYVVITAAALWLPYLILSRTRRYRAIESRRKALEESFRLPTYVLQLHPLMNPQGLIGGYIDKETVWHDD